MASFQNMTFFVIIMGELIEYHKWIIVILQYENNCSINNDIQQIL